MSASNDFSIARSDFFVVSTRTTPLVSFTKPLVTFISFGATNALAAVLCPPLLKSFLSFPSTSLFTPPTATLGIEMMSLNTSCNPSASVPLAI